MYIIARIPSKVEMEIIALTGREEEQLKIKNSNVI